jgi:hypothetical protein
MGAGASAAACAKPVEPILEVTPPSGILLAGQSAQLAVTRRFPGGPSELVTSRATYATSDSNSATVSPGGLVVAGSEAGPVVIRVGDPDSDAFANASFTVESLHATASANLLALVVSPNPATIPLGGTLTFSARGVFDDGTSRDLTPLVGWTSSSTAVARIEGGGGATGVAAGGTTITASTIATASASTDGGAGTADAGAPVVSGSAAAIVQ